MNWTDPKTNELTEGFKEKGFLPEAFINMLAVLGWNDGTEKELYSMDELIASFDIKRVHSAGARFDYEKAKWFNHEWIKKLNVEHLKLKVKEVLSAEHIEVSDDAFLEKVVELVKDRCTLLPDFVQHAGFFFKAPVTLDLDAVKPKWSEEKKHFFEEFIIKLSAISSWDLHTIENAFKNLAAEKNSKPGELQLPMRIMLVGGKFGPAVFQVAELIGKEETVKRVKYALSLL
jgi:glutamyl-tRNA synthetase